MRWEEIKNKFKAMLQSLKPPKVEETTADLIEDAEEDDDVELKNENPVEFIESPDAAPSNKPVTINVPRFVFAIPTKAWKDWSDKQDADMQQVADTQQGADTQKNVSSGSPKVGSPGDEAPPIVDTPSEESSSSGELFLSDLIALFTVVEEEVGWVDIERRSNREDIELQLRLIKMWLKYFHYVKNRLLDTDDADVMKVGLKLIELIEEPESKSVSILDDEEESSISSIEEDDVASVSVIVDDETKAEIAPAAAAPNSGVMGPMKQKE